MSTAMSFTPGFDANISGITMWGFGMIRTTPLIMNIHADDNNKPGAIIFNLSGTNPGDAWSEYNFTATAVGGGGSGSGGDKPGGPGAPNGTGNIRGGRKYWVVGSSLAPGAIYGWGHTQGGGGEVGMSGWTIGDNPKVRHLNGAWEDTNWIPSQFRVNGQPVPEPASMLALGLGGIMLLRRRSR